VTQRFADAARWWSVVTCALLPVRNLCGQTNDAARLSFGISIGRVGSANLWDVPDQPIVSTFAPSPDVFHLKRQFRPGLTVSGQLTYFANPRIGFAGELTYISPKRHDTCTVVQDDGDASLIAACNAITFGDSTIVQAGNDADPIPKFVLQSPRILPVTAVLGGVILRPWTRGLFQPFVKALAGIAFTPSSTILTRAFYSSSDVLTVYQDDHWKSIRPTATLAGGFHTAPNHGYQFEVEVRESWFAQSVVTGPSIYQGLNPPSKAVIKGFTSIMAGFDVVLAKRRGRRY